jgi:energy-coupling factor transporter ATP-binding protein EcfA2
MTTADKVQQYLTTHCKVFKKGDTWRSTSPLRADSDSDSFSVTFNGPEHGAWHCHVTDDGGSLYDLAGRLGIDLPERAPSENTHRAFDGMGDYATSHGVTVDVLKAAGWTDATYSGRPAMAVPTANGIRYRFLDNKGNRWTSPSGYKACWYGLERAVKIATDYSLPIFIANGEPAVVVGQHYEVPAITVTGGEGAIPENLLTELRRKWSGDVVLLYDNDEKGRSALDKQKAQLPDALPLDMKMAGGGDLADFCRLHGKHSRKELTALIPSRSKNRRKASAYTEERKARVISAMASPGAIRGYTTGLRGLDKMWSGVQRGRQYVLYGDTGMGKSTLLASMIPALLASGARILVDPTETHPGPYLDKLACAMISTNASPVTFDMLEDGLITPQQYELYEAALNKLEAAPLEFMDKQPKAADIVTEARYAIKDFGMSIFISDSLSNINGSTTETYIKTVEAADALQNTTRLKVAVVATSQVGRNLKERKNKIPTLNDAQGGGRIEQNADLVMAVYRHHYYVEKDLAEEHPDFGPRTTALICLKDRWRGNQGKTVRAEMVGGARFQEQAPANLTPFAAAAGD